MSPSELDDLDRLFGHDDVFKSRGKRRQAPSRFQLGLLVYRLAHGHDTATIAKYFGIARGTVHLWTTRALYAICKRVGDHIQWPDPVRREACKKRILDIYGVPHCLGYIDGVHINLDRAPSQGASNGAFHGRKERYGFNILAACDHRKRFIFVQWGFSARSSDMRLQAASRIHTTPELFFDPGEFLLADSGFTCTPHIIPMFKRRPGELNLARRRAKFNEIAAPARVNIEHAFGILKGRWQMLRNAKLKVATKADEARAHAFIQAAFVLHNLTVSTYAEYMTDEEVRELHGLEEREQQQSLVGRRDYENFKGDHRRRELLVDQILELDAGNISE